MKIIKNKENKILKSNIDIENEKQFTISATAESFSALSDLLYKDKQTSIVRELLCNAWDSHIQAKNTHTPVDIRLNNDRENSIYNLSIQDYGVGLKEQDVYDIYTTYFKSTKRDTNKYVGSFGLGSKTPFSYVSEFIIESVYDNIETKYLCFLNNNNIPSIKKLSTKDTNNHNGLKISIEIKDHYDSDSFETSILGFLNYNNFPVNFYYNNKLCSLKRLADKTTRVVLDKYYILNEVYYKGYYIKQGECVYWIDYNIIKNIDSYSNHKCLFPLENMLIDVNIGTFMPTISRENLQYNDDFYKKINKLLKNYIDYITNDIQKELGDNYFDNLKILIKKKEEWGIGSDIEILIDYFMPFQKNKFYLCRKGFNLDNFSCDFIFYDNYNFKIFDYLDNLKLCYILKKSHTKKEILAKSALLKDNTVCFFHIKENELEKLKKINGVDKYLINYRDIKIKKEDKVKKEPYLLNIGNDTIKIKDYQNTNKTLYYILNIDNNKEIIKYFKNNRKDFLRDCLKKINIYDVAIITEKQYEKYKDSIVMVDVVEFFINKYKREIGRLIDIKKLSFNYNIKNLYKKIDKINSNKLKRFLRINEYISKMRFYLGQDYINLIPDKYKDKLHYNFNKIKEYVKISEEKYKILDYLCFFDDAMDTIIDFLNNNKKIC